MGNGAEELLEQLDGLAGLAELRAVLQSLGRRDIHVVVVGEFNNGKSTLINALLRRRLLISSAVPTTGQVTYVRFGRKERVHVRWNGGNVEYPLKRLKELTTLDDSGVVASEVEQVTVVCNTRLLKPDRVLVDTPGTNDDRVQSQRMREVVQAVVGTADVIVWVLRADISLPQGERRLAGQWMTENPSAVLVPVVNFMNLVAAEQRALVRQRLTGLLEQQVGPHVSWIVGLTGKLFFEVDAQRTLDWATAGVGEPDADFLTLVHWLRQLSGAAGEQVQARRRTGWVGPKLGRMREASRERLLQLRSEAEAVRRMRETRRREAEARERRLKNRAETLFARVEQEAGQKLSEERLNLLNVWLKNESVSSLRQNTSRWGKMKLEQAVASIVVATAEKLHMLAGEFAVPWISVEVAAASLPVEFSVTLPVTRVRDDLRDLVGALPMDDYLAKLRGQVQREWEQRAALVKSALKQVWDKHIEVIERELQKHNAAEELKDSHGWTWAVLDEFVAIKMRELWLQRGAPPLVDREALTDRDKVRRQLQQRMATGEPLRRELLQCEVADAALECLEKQYVYGVGTGAQKGQHSGSMSWLWNRIFKRFGCWRGR